MTPERWQQITDIFELALRRDAPERAAFLLEACNNDDELRQEVESLLASHEQAGRFIEEPAVAVAAKQSAGGDGASLAGQTLAHYHVLSLLGSGGMGDVYLALDTKLGRRVALKVLPDYLAGDAQRVRLFTKEARAASALNHPNIITIYEIGQLEDRYYIAMEFIDGETLREKIHRDKAPLEKLLKYLQQVAEALTKAHSAGIVHRDLKPDNIMVTRDGYTKVLDFGLAKLIEPPKQAGINDPSSSEVATARMPQHSLPGLVMGTAGYMSHEQAQGKVKEIDHRSDIFSFGCILFEAATAQKAFEGKDALDSLHKIVHSPTPQIREVNAKAPDELQKIVRRCLQKDPEKRYQSIKDVAIELEELGQELKAQTEPERPTSAELSSRVLVTGAASTQSATSAAPTTEVTSRPTSSAEYLVGEIKRHKTGAIFVAAALVIALGAGLLFLTRQGYIGRQSNGSAPVSFERMKLTRLTTTGRAADAAISPDGKYVAYLNIEGDRTSARQFVGTETASIWIRQVATSRDIKIVEPGQFILRGMTFSPDSNYLYYRVAKPNEPNQLFRIPVLGGDAQKVIYNIFSQVAFSPDGKRLAFVRNHNPVAGESHLLIANADGSDERIIATHKGGELFALPSRPTAPVWSPDGKVLACALGRTNGTISLLEVQVEGGAEKQIGTRRWSNIDSVSWLPDGSALMLTARDQSSPQRQIWQVAYPSGEAHRVTNDLNDYQGMSLTADANQMVVVQIDRQANLWIAPSGKPDEARAVTSGAGKSDGGPGISWTPDGKLVYASTASGNRDIWLMDVSRGTQRQLTSDARQNYYPVVTPDGRAIIFYSDRGDAIGLWRMEIDGSNPKQLISAPILGHVTCSPDGKWIVYSSVGTKGIPALWKIGMDGGEPLLLNDEYWEEMPSISPDGKQIAFQYFNFTQGVPVTIGLLPLDGGQITKLVEPPFRLNPTMRWTPDGSAIAYMDNRGGVGNIWALPLGGGAPKQLTYFKSDSLFWFDWSRDGRWLALSRGTQTSDVVLISNFR